MRLKKTKALRYVVATFLTMGTVLSVGFLSFSGLWIICPYIIPAILAFFLSGVIEGKVFGTSIFKGLARLKLLTSNAEKYLLFSDLNKCLGKKSFQEKYECGFLSNYYGQIKEYKKLKNDANSGEGEIKEAKKRLEELKAFFYRELNKPNSDIDTFLSPELKKNSINELKSAKRSVWLLRFFWIISILTGVVSGFVTAFAVQEAITVGLALSLSATAVSVIVWPVALFAAIGATFLLYYAITEIVKNDAISEAFSKTLELFKRKTEESIIVYLFRLLALSLVIAGITGLTVFAMAASAGTYWVVMRKGIKLLAPKLPVFIAYCASAILIPINFATDLIYGFSTTLQTIDNCKNIFLALFEAIRHPIKGIKNFCSNIETKLDKLKKKESWGQFFNPFRILARLVISPLQTLVFLGHLISIGFTADRFLNFSPPLVASAVSVSEGLSDISFFTIHRHDDNNGHDHDHGNLLQLPLQVLFSPVLLIVGVLYWAIKSCGNQVGFFDAIKQTFELPLLNIVFFPLLLLSATWHWIFKKETDNLTFFELIKQSFEVHTHDHKHEHEEESTEFNLSQEWTHKKLPKIKLDEAINRLRSAWFGGDIAKNKLFYLKKLSSEEELKRAVDHVRQGNHISDFSPKKAENKIENSEVDYNGHISSQSQYRDSRINKNSFITIFNINRTLCSGINSGETKTSRIVKDAFRLVPRTTQSH
jgi:hypothetical protein